jgi:DNA adenine methylase
MRYVGGKSKLASSIAELIGAHAGGCHTYLEPFVGGGAVLAEVIRQIPMAEYVASDAHLDLVMMYQALRGGWWPLLPSESDYAALKHAGSSAQRGFTGFGCSFGGKWFGGYARGGYNGTVPRNHQAESLRALAADYEALRKASFWYGDYRQWQPVTGTVVYCDPPYADSQAYSVGAFDHGTF